MMFSKSTVLATILAVTQVAVATPPACLLAAVNTQQDPSDLSTVCKAPEVLSTLKSACHDEYSTALTAYKSICKGAGITVSAPSTPSKPQQSGSKSQPSSSPSNASGKSGSPSSSSSGTSSGKPSSAKASGDANSGSKNANSGPENAGGRLEAGAFMAMVAAGLVAAL